ncbi:MAG: cytochrome c biogenesis protein ResB [Desulfobulbus sp.]|jgi:cytochrome c biogenesis protein|uniref:cytochrome c biogenesis protein ResB n=1 Tax=Desulfobulbus sp. TaxID=895 RepID=UPI00284791A6|nr:cytochrome c biogenesis protein ResB [Desulfobulbus sp.]MDR2550499.1 cytochrome c biogenesis protein ResB [Desulfobulbus sp.]
MTTQKKNALFDLFASVQLALFLLFLLASTSIVGTIVPQNNPFTFYVERYGFKTARFFQLLDIPDMYNSWWFLGLLTLFALNLIVCSIERIPQAIRQFRRDVLAVSSEQLEKFPLRSELHLAGEMPVVAGRVATLLKRHGWHAKEGSADPGRIYGAEKGKWSRFGLYVVHCSILVILAGALLGSSAVAHKVFGDPLFAFKGSVMLPEGEQTDHVYAHKGNERLDLGFALHCDDFSIAYYDNGMPKTYRSKVTVLEHGAPVQTTEIEVNKPLTYKGVTFYQSSYQPYQDYQATLKKKDGSAETTARIPVAQQIDWPEGGVSYGIINRERQGEVTRQLKIWFTDGRGEPSVFWVHADQEAAIERPSGTYLLTIRQRYATGLQATKDPGVELVYGGCLLMLVGLYIAFFLSHRRLYVLVQPEEKGCRLLFAGDANKNRVGFERYFLQLISKLDNETK